MQGKVRPSYAVYPAKIRPLCYGGCFRMLATQRISKLLVERRGSRPLRAVARKIGIAPATLSRIERGAIPDLIVFQKICRWLKVDPVELLDLPTTQAREAQRARHITAQMDWTEGVVEFLEAVAELLHDSTLAVYHARCSHTSCRRKRRFVRRINAAVQRMQYLAGEM